MRITNLLDKNAILLNADISDKNTAINTLIEMHDKAGNLSDKEKYKEGIFAREAESTTAVGEGIAIPHAKSARYCDRTCCHDCTEWNRVWCS